MTQTIGVAGCGRMGLPMARALARAGFDVAGFDIRPLAEFGDFAPAMVPDPADFAARCETVLTVVRDIPQTEALLFDDQALLDRPNAIRTLIVCSTVSPRYILDLRARVPEAIAMVDAPMSGAAVAAEEARLSFMLGGDPADLDRLAPLFEAMGRDIHRLGPLGAGMTAKVLNNLVAASSTVATRAAIAWADALGVDRRALLAVMHDSSGQTWFGSNFDRIEFARDGLAADNTISILAKDVASALDAAPEGPERAFAEAVIAALKSFRQI
jgi:3-hydroxyisobutyrate dehydrogenase-like beta-hydroxyacid dehydrogenase